MATSQNATWTLSGVIIPTQWLSVIVRYICYACLGVGMFFMLPFVFLIILDFFLWVYRVCANKQGATKRTGHTATPRLSTTEAAASTAVASTNADDTSNTRIRSRRA